jgi:DNA-binding response OmpR family regulator
LFLVVENDPKIRLRTQLELYRLGILSAGIGFGSAHRYLRAHKIYLILIPRAESEGKPPYFCKNLRRHFPDIPSVMLADHSFDGKELRDTADLLIRAPYSPVSVVRKSVAYLKERCGIDLADRIAGGVRSRIEYGVSLYGYAADFTLTERMLLAALIDLHPDPVPPEKLLKLFAKPGTSPTLATLAPHISRINKKACEIILRPIIGFMPGLGYYIRIKKGKSYAPSTAG